MAKKSGGTRTIDKTHSLWNGNTDIASQKEAENKIYRLVMKEAGLWDNKPLEVTEREYEQFKKSGEFIEAYRGMGSGSLNSFTKGEYYLSNEQHERGNGYYFTTEKSRAENYAKKNNGIVVTVLVNKKGMINAKDISLEQQQKQLSKYVGEKKAYNVDSYDAGLIMQKSTYAVTKGGSSLFVGNKNGDIVVMDRKSIIIKRKK